MAVLGEGDVRVPGETWGGGCFAFPRAGPAPYPARSEPAPPVGARHHVRTLSPPGLSVPVSTVPPPRAATFASLGSLLDWTPPPPFEHTQYRVEDAGFGTRGAVRRAIRAVCRARGGQRTLQGYLIYKKTASF